MSKLIFLDTEATGNDPKSDRLCQICFEVEGQVRTEYFKPPIPVSVKAMSITHITNKMLEDQKSFEGSEMKAELQELLQEGVLVAHNALFDIAMLKAEGVTVPQFICTLRVARHLDPENKIPEYNLQFLRYFLGLEIKGGAHDAEEDVRVLHGVFDRLLIKMKEKHGSDEAALKEMMAVSSRPSIFGLMPFGKYKGKTLSEVVETDRAYLEWLLNQKLQNEEDDQDWVYTLKHYLSV